MAGFCALIECNIKKIIALSTLSQLGVIIISLGIGYPILGYFHIIIHALFKALLFICAGRLIHLFNHNQDLRYLGNIMHQLPLTIRCIIISNLSLCGFPFLRGFFSKDLIIEYSYYRVLNNLVYYFYILGAFLTFIYSLRFLYYCSFTYDIYMPVNYISENNKYNLVPIFILSFFSVFRGGVFNWFIFPYFECFIRIIIKNILLIILVRLFCLYMKLIEYNFIMWIKLSFIINFLNNILFLNYLRGQIIIYYLFKNRNKIFIRLDQGWIELIGPKGIYILFNNYSSKLIRIHIKLFIRNILLIFFILVVILIY